MNETSHIEDNFIEFLTKRISTWQYDKNYPHWLVSSITEFDSDVFFFCTEECINDGRFDELLKIPRFLIHYVCCLLLQYALVRKELRSEYLDKITHIRGIKNVVVSLTPTGTVVLIYQENNEYVYRFFFVEERNVLGEPHMPKIFLYEYISPEEMMVTPMIQQLIKKEIPIQ